MERILLVTVKIRQCHRFVADNSLLPIALCRINASEIGVRFGASNKEGASLVKREKSLEIQVRSIHNVDRRWLGNHQIECVDIVQLAVGSVNKTLYIASQIQQRVHLDYRFGAAK
jgi:L-rhamnose isomerase